MTETLRKNSRGVQRLFRQQQRMASTSLYQIFPCPMLGFQTVTCGTPLFRTLVLLPLTCGRGILSSNLFLHIVCFLVSQSVLTTSSDLRRFNLSVSSISVSEFTWIEYDRTEQWQLARQRCRAYRGRFCRNLRCLHTAAWAIQPALRQQPSITKNRP